MAVIRSATAVNAALWLGIIANAATTDWRCNSPVYGTYTDATAYDVLPATHAPNANAPLILLALPIPSTIAAVIAIPVRLQPLSAVSPTCPAVRPGLKGGKAVGWSKEGCFKVAKVSCSTHLNDVPVWLGSSRRIWQQSIAAAASCHVRANADVATGLPHRTTFDDSNADGAYGWRPDWLHDVAAIIVGLTNDAADAIVVGCSTNDAVGHSIFYSNDAIVQSIKATVTAVLSAAIDDGTGSLVGLVVDGYSNLIIDANVGLNDANDATTATTAVTVADRHPIDRAFEQLLSTLPTWF